MPKYVKINEDDLREIFSNRPQHLSHPDRQLPEGLAFWYEQQNEPEEEWLGNRVTDARRIWGKVPFVLMDEIREYTNSKPSPHKWRRELVQKLAALNPNDDAERLMQWAVSCCVFNDEQLQEIEDNRPKKIEFNKRELAIKQGMKTAAEIEARMQFIQDLWKKSRDTGSENPEDYLKTSISESAIEDLEKMCREGATLPEMARECAATNKAIKEYFNGLSPARHNYLFKDRDPF